jgi:hypothetical protein
MGANGSKDKGTVVGTLPDSAIVEVETTVETARELIKALTLNEAMTGPLVNPLLSELSRVLMVAGTPKSGKGKVVGKNPVTKTAAP